MKLESFCLIGHSQGGYIAGNYTVKYPQHIKKLILISPIGIKVAIENNEILEETNNDALYGSKYSPPEWIKPIMTYLWENRMSPFNVGRILGEITSK
jgi:pimeloyl-ACP methyl ester carboxylesterase